MDEKIKLKQDLLAIAIQHLQARIAAIRESIDNAQANANEEEKSSAGDKYETSRAISQNEKDMFTRQLHLNNLELSEISKIDCSRIYDHIVPGSMFKTKSMSFLIVAGLGKIVHQGETVYFLSPNAPLSQAVYGKKVND